MKKFLLFFLIGCMTVISEPAFSYNPLRAACEKNKDTGKRSGYIWLDKTNACIPRNACNSTNDKERAAYCLDYPLYGRIYENASDYESDYEWEYDPESALMTHSGMDGYIKSPLRQYVHEILETKIESAYVIKENQEKNKKYVALYTADGRYFVVPLIVYDDIREITCDMVMSNFALIYATQRISANKYTVTNQKACEKFAKSINDSSFSVTSEFQPTKNLSGTCTLTCTNKLDKKSGKKK